MGLLLYKDILLIEPRFNVLLSNNFLDFSIRLDDFGNTRSTITSTIFI